MQKYKEVFIIDDDNVYSFVAGKILENLRISNKITIFNTAEGAIKELKCRSSNNYPNLIILDIIMPIMDGWSFIQHLKNLPESHKIKLAIHTAVMNEKDLINFKKSNIPIIPKPFLPENLADL
ncbi:MAG: response regulator [Cytophagaceae bacterium]